MSVLQRLYDSEINATVSSFYYDGFYVKLGDEMNGFRAAGRCQTWADVEEWLTAMGPMIRYRRRPRLWLCRCARSGPGIYAWTAASAGASATSPRPTY